MKDGVLTKEELSEHVIWSGCGQHCKGGQHVGRTCTYVVGELKDLDISVRCGAHRSMIANKEAVLNAIYEIYLNT